MILGSVQVVHSVLQGNVVESSGNGADDARHGRVFPSSVSSSSSPCFVSSADLHVISLHSGPGLFLGSSGQGGSDIGGLCP